MADNDPLGSIELKSEKGYGQKVVESIPLAGGAVKVFNSATGAAEGDLSLGDVLGLASDSSSFVQSCMSAAKDIASDPLGWLIGEGLDFLISVVQPLQDLIQMVSGDGPALSTAAENFNSIGQGLAEFGQKFGEDAVTALSDWEGSAAETAAEKLAEFSKGIGGVANEASNISKLLQISSMIMTVIEDFIKALLTELVTWLVMIWIPALAAAVPTLGASTVAAGSATGVRAVQTGAQATQKVSKLQQLLNKIKDLLAKMKTWMSDLKTNFRQVMDTKKMQSSLARLEVESPTQTGLKHNWSTRIHNAESGMIGERVSGSLASSMKGEAKKNLREQVTKPGSLLGHLDDVRKVGEYGSTGEEQPTEETREQLDF